MIKIIKNNFEILIVLLFLTITKLYLITSKTHNLFWDESIYIGISKEISSLGEFGLFENIRPIILPFFISIIDLIFKNKILSSEITILIFTIGCVLMTYLIGKELFSKYVGLMGGILLLITPLFFTYSNTIMTGIPALFFSLLSLYFTIKKRFILSGFFSAITFMTRFPIGLIVPIINLIIISKQILKNRKSKSKKIEIKSYISKIIPDLLKYNLSFLIIFLFFLLYNKIINGSFIEPLILASSHQSTLIGNIWGVKYLLYYPNMIFISFMLLFLPIYIIFNKTLRKNNKLINLIIPLLVFLIYFIIIPHKQERFLITIIPYLTILTGYILCSLYETSKKSFKIIVVVLILFTLIQPIVMNVENYNSYPKYKFSGHDEYFGFLNKLNDNLIILTSDPLPTAYTNHKYIPYYQDTKTALKIIKENINETDLIIYTKSSFPWNDAESIKEKEEFLKIIKNNSKLINNITYYGDIKEIYLINK